MKRNHIVLLLGLSLSASGYSQTAGGTGTGQTGVGGTSASSTTTSSSSSGGTTTKVIPPGVISQSPSDQNTLAPQQREGQPTQTRENPQAAANGAALGINTNQIAVPTNKLAISTNQPVISTNLAPTSQVGFTNRVLSSNTAGVMTNAGPMLMRDQALSETDRRTLVQIRAAVFGPNQAAAPPAGTPVHFILKDGAVRLVGTVPTMEERQRIENLVQQVPGVTRVFDALQVSQQPGVQPTAQ